MKRDMDLCREILRQMEVHPNPEGPIKIKIEGRPDQEITYHLHLLRQADLIEAIEKTTFAGMAYAPQRLTWKGHEFLDAARDDTIWRKAKERLLGVAGGLTFDLLLAALKAEISNRTGLNL